MLTRMTTIIAAVGVALTSTAASAGPGYVNVQNRLTTEQIDVDNTGSCGTITPPLGSVAAQTTSAASGANCGVSSYMTFDYTAPSGKKCGFLAGSSYSGGTWQPQGSAKSKGSVKATCKLYLASSSGGGTYSFLATLE